MTPQEVLYKEFDLLEAFGAEGLRVYGDMRRLIRQEGAIKAASYSAGELGERFNCDSTLLTNVFWWCVKNKLFAANYYTEPNTLSLEEDTNVN